MEKCQRRYGDIFTLRILHAGTSVLLCDPDDVKRVFTADPSSLGVSVANNLLGLVLGSRSVMLLDEPEHMSRRKLILPSFHGQRLVGDGAMIDRVAREEIARWPLEEPFELWPRMQTITLRVIMRAVFGVENERLERLCRLLERLTVWMNDPRSIRRLAAMGPGSIARSRGFRAAMAPVEAAVLGEVRRLSSLSSDCEADGIAGMLARACYADGSPISEQDLRDELMTLLTDGPTSTSLAWVFERLLRHPQKLARLREEVLAGDGGDYLDAVVKETLRLCPPVPTVARRLLEPMRLGRYVLPRGTSVAPCIHLIHRRGEIYSQPHSFNPERFLQDAPGTYTWIPFGGGVRRCLAASYAQLEMRQVIRAVLHEVELRPVDARSERVRRGAIAFSPGRRGLVKARRRPARPRGPAVAPTRGGRERRLAAHTTGSTLGR
jgi:cytochrome P450